jgi:hypothetical protein
MVKITLNSTSVQHKDPIKYFGDAGRCESLTDCDFVDDTHIVCADRQMGRLYLIEFNMNTGTHTMIDMLVTNPIQHFDLLIVCDDTVYAVCYTYILFSCKIKNMKFTQPDLTKMNRKEAYHGLCRSPIGNLVLTNMRDNTIADYSLQTKKTHNFRCREGVHIKDATFVDMSTLLVISTDGGPAATITKLYNSHILLYNYKSGALLHKYTLVDTHVDSCIYDAPYCYVTCTSPTGGGYILKCFISDKYTITETRQIPTERFPHGITIRGDLIAYTSYEESSLVIKNKDTL